MSAPWIAVVVALWAVVIVMVVVMAGVVRKAAVALERASTAGSGGQHMPIGPNLGTSLPDVKVEAADGSLVSLADLPNPCVVAVLTSTCSPCLAVADRLAGDPSLVATLDRLVVLTDRDGRARVDPGGPVLVLADAQGRVIQALGLPGTPFVLSVDADGAVRSGTILTGVEQLVHLLEDIGTRPAVRPAGTSAPVR